MLKRYAVDAARRGARSNLYSFGYHRVSSHAFSQKASFDQPGARMKVIRPELRKARSSCSRVVRRLSPEITAPPCLPTSETQSTSSVFLANDIPNVCDGIAAPFRKRI